MKDIREYIDQDKRVTNMGAMVMLGGSVCGLGICSDENGITNDVLFVNANRYMHNINFSPIKQTFGCSVDLSYVAVIKLLNNLKTNAKNFVGENEKYLDEIYDKAILMVNNASNNGKAIDFMPIVEDIMNCGQYNANVNSFVQNNIYNQTKNDPKIFIEESENANYDFQIDLLKNMTRALNDYANTLRAYSEIMEENEGI